MNFLIDPAGFSSKDNISLIIKGKAAASLFEIIQQGEVTQASLIDASTGAENSLNGIFNLNGKIFTASIPEDLYNEFTLGKAFDNNFNLPVKLQLESINNNGGNNVEIIFKTLTDSNNQNIQKALDLYSKVYSDNIETAVKSLFATDINPALQNVTVSVKGNFLFIHINLGAASGSGSGSVILTSYSPYIKDAEEKNKPLKAPQKAYMFMLETDLDPLGRIKLFSYYAGKSLSIKFQDCPPAAKELINKNLDTFKEMMSSEGIILKDISFKGAVDKNFNKGSGREAFSDGKIINERI